MSSGGLFQAATWVGFYVRVWVFVQTEIGFRHTPCAFSFPLDQKVPGAHASRGESLEYTNLNRNKQCLLQPQLKLVSYPGICFSSTKVRHLATSDIHGKDLKPLAQRGPQELRDNDPIHYAPYSGDSLEMMKHGNTQSARLTVSGMALTHPYPSVSPSSQLQSGLCSFSLMFRPPFILLSLLGWWFY